MSKHESTDFGLPTEEQIAELPRVASLAFAARCARRVLPLFRQFWPDASATHINAVDVAVLYAERFAASRPEPDLNHSFPKHVGVNYARRTAEAATVAASRRSSVESADAAAWAAETARCHAPDHPTGMEAASYADSAKEAADAIRFQAVEILRSHSVESNDAPDADAHARAIAAMRRDFDLLMYAAEQHQWTDDTPVPPEFFGPLWPDGEPEGWPGEDIAADQPPVALKLQIAVPRGMSEAESNEFNDRVVGFLAALSALDASMGGTGLQILDDASQEPVDEVSEEPIDENVGPAVEVGS